MLSRLFSESSALNVNGLIFSLTVVLLGQQSYSSFAMDVDWHDQVDPFHTQSAVGGGLLGQRIQHTVEVCQSTDLKATMSLSDVVDRVLCHNPQSQQAWSNTRYQLALLGVAKAAYLPSIQGNVSDTRTLNSNVTGDVTSASAGLNLSYVLYDFGSRDANQENAQQLFAAASATQDSTLQSLFLSAIKAYYQVNSAMATVVAAKETEHANQVSLDAATARYKAGVATPADKLQAQTAYSQAMLTRIRAEGDLRNAYGALANLMGLDANQSFGLVPSQRPSEIATFQANVDDLIAEARQRRPDFAAAEAQVNAAQANIKLAEAANKPVISLNSSVSLQDNSVTDTNRAGALGVSLTVPLFTGYANTYKIQAAKEQLALNEAAKTKLRLQIALDVWQAYQNLQTETQSIKASADLVNSAQQNLDVAFGRYKAGVGNIIDVITAQSSLASAKTQQIQAGYNWDIARASLTYALGNLNLTDTGAVAGNLP